MTFQFDELVQTRSLSREKALEDFEFFFSHVLGLKVSGPVREENPSALVQKAYALWVRLVAGEAFEESPSETFTWLFADRLERVA